ncbi:MULTISPECIES: DUF3828 domain-containing protein [unclassified Paraburkholderia]|uniref:DUF3828 domain-containing protein n=1 Tax=unclassified Paraburkholderia TaxID=2615204 RepID=UPI002AB2D369|nr:MULTISPECIES: DUF3828 domain-containing protein [unclassified Paraburkholderia]
MKRILSILALGALTLCHNAFASGPADTPDARAGAFYTWYLKTGSDLTYPLLKAGIVDFVAKDTVNRLRSDYRHNRLPEDVDYFLKVQDEDEQDWLSHIAPHQAVMLGDVAIVPMTFGSKSQTNVVVFMRRIAGVWKITKVDSTLDYR